MKTFQKPAPKVQPGDVLPDGRKVVTTWPDIEKETSVLLTDGQVMKAAEVAKKMAAK